MSRGGEETLAIPRAMRAEVDERDGRFCRFCGQYSGQGRALHHIDFGGMGARRRHAPSNLLTVGWMFEHDCHSILHSNKKLYLPYALKAAVTPGVTVLQLMRWDRARILKENQ